MKYHILALVVVALISCIIGAFLSVFFLESIVKEATLEAFDYYIETHGEEIPDA